MDLDNDEFLIENGILLDYRSTKQDVVIPEGVTKIGKDVFAFKKINTIKFPSTLKTIASRAFMWAKMPNRLDFPESLECIEDLAFDSCKIHIICFNSYVQLGDNFKYKAVNIIIGPKGNIKILKYFKNIKSLTLSCHLNILKALDLRDIPTLHIDCLDCTLEEIEKFINELNIHYLLPEQIVFNSFNFSYYITKILEMDLMKGKYLYFENTPTLSKEEGSVRFYFYDQVLKSCSSKLVNITLPKGEYSIGTDCFISNNLFKVILPEGINEIRFEAFKENDLEELTIPSSIRYIGINAFQKNYNLRVLKLLSSRLVIEKNAFLETAIDTVFCTIKAEINVGINCDCGFEKHISLNINCQNNNDYLYILKQIANLKKVFKNSSLILYNVPKNCQFIIKMRYPLTEFKEDSNILNSQVVEETFNINVENEEIKAKILEINKLIQNLEPQEQNNISSIVTNLVRKFQEQQQSLKPSYKANTAVLTLNSDLFLNLHILKNNLLTSLDNIIKKINNKALYLNLLADFKKYKNKLNSNEKLEYSNDLVEEIIRISKEKNLENIKTQLVALLDDTSKNVSNYLLNGLSNCEFNLELADEDYLKIFDKEVLKLYTIASNKEIVLNAFKGIGDNALVKDINTINEIINLLNIEFQEEMKQKLNKILDNIEEEEYLKNYNQIELIIRRFLQDYLLELKEKIRILTVIQNIIDDINNVNKPSSNNTLIISSLISEIIKSCPSEIAQEVKEEIEEVINKWRTKINNKEYQLNNQEYGNLNEATVLTLHILKDLYEIKFNIEKYQTDISNFHSWEARIKMENKQI